MNETENKLQDTPDLAQLTEQCAELRRHARLAFIGLVVVSLTLTAFVGLQSRRASKDLHAVRSQAMELLDRNNKETVAIQGFVGRLIEYSQSHPDFTPILLKYNIKPPTGPTPGMVPPLPPVAAPGGPAGPKR